jgi:hypothetical protein
MMSHLVSTKPVMTVMKLIAYALNLTECGEMMTDITEQDEQDEMLAKFWADYGESIWVDPAEQEELWDEKNFI